MLAGDRWGAVFRYVVLAPRLGIEVKRDRLDAVRFVTVRGRPACQRVDIPHGPESGHDGSGALAISSRMAAWQMSGSPGAG